MVKREHEDHGAIDIDRSKPIALDVANANGAVTIRRTDGDRLLWRSTKHGTPGTPWYDQMQVAVEHDANRVRVTVEHPFGNHGQGIAQAVIETLKGGSRPWEGSDWAAPFRGHNVSVDLEIELPTPPAAQIHEIHVKTASGDVEVGGVKALVQAATASGDIAVRDVRGEAALTSASGDIAITGGELDVAAKTASGEVRVEATALGKIGVTTMSGDAAVAATLRGGEESYLESMSGDIRLALAATDHAGATVTFRSMSGEAKVDGAARKIARRAWRVGPGDQGGAGIAVKTMSGDLDLRLRHEPSSVPIPPLPPQPPAPAQAPPDAPTEPIRDERLALLRALERGEIDVDEAMRQLEAV